MIIEYIIVWLLNVIQWAIDLFPDKGDLLWEPYRDFSTDFFKFVNVINGYAPIKELVLAFNGYIALSAMLISYYGIRKAIGFIKGNI